MGMAASQARYLALVARKSNCEYEGQQINQARLVLSNQTANLFNQMLGLQVPVPPSTQDYTKTQYSFKTGSNEATIDKWDQLANPEPDYNYVVSYHFYNDVYTGSQKRLVNPQVQFSSDTSKTYNIEELNKAVIDLTRYKQLVDSLEAEKTEITSEKSTLNAQKALLDSQRASLESSRTAVEESLNPDLSTDKSVLQAQYAELEGQKTEKETQKADLETQLKTISNYDEGTYDSLTNITYDSENDIYQLNNGDRTYTNYSTCSQTEKESIEALVNKMKENGIISDSVSLEDVFYNSIDNSIAFRSDLNNALTSNSLPVYQLTNASTAIDNYNDQISDISAEIDTISDNMSAISLQIDKLTQIEDYDAQIDKVDEEIAPIKERIDEIDNRLIEIASLLEGEEGYIAKLDEATEHYNSYNVPTYVGNCPLSLLEDLDTNQEAELLQVWKDMKEVNPESTIFNCFSSDGKSYLGGIYKFTMSGNTYYTTIYDLESSWTSGTGINHIDGQDKLYYYNASMVKTKFEKKEKALLETDSNGRFTSVRFEDDSVAYTLNVEQITDDAAYKDAMNQFNYENAIYAKMVQDINAKTSLIQQEDRTLELRLKQLDTEQNALSQEMDAVQKVVKDNVEKSFKTFGG